ncbi:hypothetical protein V8C35DRAFT_280851 [Trichoderma chlorosporum]
MPALAMDRGLGRDEMATAGDFILTLPPSKMIASSTEICNFGRGAYDTTGLPKPPPPQPQ